MTAVVASIRRLTEILGDDQHRERRPEHRRGADRADGDADGPGDPQNSALVGDSAAPAQSLKLRANELLGGSIGVPPRPGLNVLSARFAFRVPRQYNLRWCHMR